MSSKGSLNPKASVKVVWGIVTAGFAIIMMLAKGLEGLESAVISGAFPFIFLYIIIIVALMKALKKDYDFIKQDKFIGTIDINQGSQRIES